jgi:DNA-binding response OmpR family regulator
MRSEDPAPGRLRPSNGGQGEIRPGRGQKSSRTILLIEDDPTTLRLLSHFLEESGFAVVTTGQPEEGIRLARETSPGLIILGLILPRMDGFQVIERLKHDPALAAVPVFIISALAGEDEIVRAIDLGAAEYFTKPFSPRIVLAKIRQVLR